MRVKATKLFQRRKRSDHKMWKRKWVFLRPQKEVKWPWKAVPCLNYNQAHIIGTRVGFFNHGTICHKLKHTEWWKCALIAMRQYYKHPWKTELNLINNSLINCAGQTVVISQWYWGFITLSLKSAFISKPEKTWVFLGSFCQKPEF